MRVIFAAIFLFFTRLLTFGQDPVFSQFHASPIQLNPAFAGDEYSGRLAVNYRLQWPGLSAAYNTFSLGYDQFFRRTNLAMGINILSDGAGDGALKTNKISGIVGYRLKVGEDTYIKGGLEMALIQKKLNWEKLLFYDAIAESGGNVTPGGSYLPSKEIEPSNTNRSFLDIGSGFLLYNKDYFFGVTLDHLNTPLDDFLQNQQQNYVGLPMRWSIHGGYQYLFGKRSKNNLPSYLSPNFLYTRQAGFSQLNLSVNASFDQIFGGLGFRHSASNGDAFIISAGLRTQSLRIGYSFDFTVSNITISEGGAHELSLGYIFGEAKKTSKINDCLNLFR
jgi:type IX secretion system PorP/SprF family membrane protein